jgi:hypothetical protein
VVCLVALADLPRRIGRWPQMVRVAGRGEVLERFVMRGVVRAQRMDIGRGGPAVYRGRVRNDQNRLRRAWRGVLVLEMCIEPQTAGLLAVAGVVGKIRLGTSPR